jgi:UDP-glucose 4-epimerase
MPDDATSTNGDARSGPGALASEALRAKRVVVTGGSGFIGGHVVAALCRLGADVVSVDRRPPRASWRCHPGPAAGALPPHSVAAVQGDLREPGVVEAAVAPGTAAVVHLAAQTQVLRSIEDPQGTFDNNVVVTSALLERARHLGVASFVLASTNAVVGAGAGGVLHEGVPLAPLTPYGATKAAGEMLLSCYSSAYGVRGVALRFTNVYGPGMSEKDSIVPRLMRAAGSGEPFEVYGDGKQVRDYVNVADVVSAVIIALENPEISGPLVIGYGASVSVLDIIELVEGALGSRVEVRHVGAKAGEMPAVVVDNSKARSWGWEPAVTLEAGVAEVVSEWGARAG